MCIPGQPDILATKVAGSPSSTALFFGPSTTAGAFTASMGLGFSKVSGGPTGTVEKYIELKKSL